MKYFKLVLNTVQASGADCLLSNGFLAIGGYQIPFNTLFEGAVRKPYVAQVLQIDTCAVTAANSTQYGYQVISNSTIDGRQKAFVCPPFTSDATATKTEISTKIVAALNTYADRPYVAALTGSAPNEDFTITASAPWARFKSGLTPESVGTIVPTVSPAGVIGVGAGSLILAGNYSSPDIISTNNYSTYILTYGSNSVINDGSQNSDDLSQLILYVNEAATNFESLCGTYGTLTQALLGNTATYSAGTGTLAADDSDDLLTLATGTFTGQDILPGDVLFQNGETTYYKVLSPVSIATALSNVPADNAAAAYTIIKIRSAV